MNLPPPTERQARIIWLAVTGLAMATLAALVIGVVWGLGRVVDMLAPVLWPLAVAGVVACLLDPVVDFIERRGAPRSRAVLAVFALALVVVVALFSSVVPQLVRETRDLAARVPAYAQRLQHQAEDWVNHPPRFLRKLLGGEAPTTNAPAATPATNENASVVSTNPPPDTGAPAASPPAPLLGGGLNKQDLQNATGWVAKSLPVVGSWLVGQLGKMASWFGVLAGLALIPVYAFYFLLEKRGISSSWTEYLPLSDSTFKQELVFVLSSINNYLVAFFRGQVLVAVCDGILYGFGFLIVGLPYALLIGVAAIFLTIIPFLGAIVICVTALIIAIVQFGDWQHPLLVLAVFGVVQTLEGLVISPRIMGDRVGLHPLAIIIAVMAGTTLLGGLLGGLLAIPLTAALRVVMFR